jgi:hypothetical protein
MNYHLWMHGGDQVMILIFGTHFSLVRYSEEIELVVTGSWYRCGVLHSATDFGKQPPSPRHTMQETLVPGKVQFFGTDDRAGDQAEGVLSRGVNAAIRC